MSVSLWAYSPEKCDGDFCCGDCDLCNKVDVVSICRCKDCKYSKEYSDKQLECRWFDTLVFPNDFCSNGKRKEE